MKFEPMRLLVLNSCLFSLLAFASAQEQQVRLKVDLVSWGSPASGLTLKSLKGKTTKAESFTYNETLTYSGPQVLSIYQVEVEEPDEEEEENEGGDESPARPIAPPEPSKPVDLDKIKSPLVKRLFERRKKEPELVCLVSLPSDSRHVTILLAPSLQGTFKPYVIDDDPNKLPEGKLRIHNLTGFPVGIEQINGKQKAPIAPNKHFLFDPDDGDRFKYKISYMKGKEWKKVTDNVIRVPAEQQTQLVVLQSNNDFFVNTDGGRQGFFQYTLLQRGPQQ